MYVVESKCPRRLAWPRTSPFHGGNTGSNPVGDANNLSNVHNVHNVHDIITTIFIAGRPDIPTGLCLAVLE
jgi:hypothetical protein